jgi:hypothetical protein
MTAGYQPVFHSAALFNPSQSVRDQASKDLIGFGGACLFVIDPISLQHPGVRSRLGEALQDLGRGRCAFAVFPPVGAYANDLARGFHLFLKECPEIKSWRTQYHQEVNPLAEFTTTGFHGLRRWLRQTFPELVTLLSPAGKGTVRSKPPLPGQSGRRA